MNCDKFRSNTAAFLAEELDERTANEYRLHAAECSKCAAEMNATAAMIDVLRAHPEKEVPECVEARVLDNLRGLRGLNQQPKPLPLSLRSYLQGVFTMKRILITAGLAVIAVALGLGILPLGKQNAVMAQVARALEEVQTVHLTGYSIDRKGERVDFEMWMKQPRKTRLQARSGAVFQDIFDDGTRSVVLNKSGKDCSVTISRSKESGLLIPGLDWFTKEGMLEKSNMGIMETRSITLPDGRPAQIIELGGINPDYYKSVVTIDEETDLLVQVEEYREGKLTLKFENIDYNIDLPDSALKIEIPRNALIHDTFNPKPQSPERKATEDSIRKEMDEQDGDLIAGMAHGSCGSPYHTGLRFTVIPPRVSIWYIKSRNAYYILGKARITDSKLHRYSRVVEDGYFTAPYKQDRLPGMLVMRIDKPGDFKKFTMPFEKGYNYFCAERIQNVGNGPFIIMETGMGALEFYGKGKVLPQGKLLANGQKVVQEFDIRPVWSLYDFAKADFGNLPAAEVDVMKVEMRKHNAALQRYWKNEKTAEERLGKEAFRGSNWMPGSGGQDNYFHADPEFGMIIYYIPSRDSVYVAGRAKLVQRHFFRRIERIVENEEVPAPSPDYKRGYEQRQKEERQAREYIEYRKNAKQRPLLTRDEWQEQHPE